MATTKKKAKKKTTKKPTKKVAPAPLTLAEAMQLLEANGKPGTVKIFRNHGVTAEMFGVSYAFLKDLHKRCKVDHDLAQELWATGNHDARVFACWVADKDRATQALLGKWAKGVDNHVIAHEVASLAQDCDFAHKLADKWIARKDEWHTTLGWSVIARLATQVERPPSEGGLTDDDLKAYVAELVESIHQMPNRTRHAMNGALISIGCRSQAWRKRATAAAKKVGAVEVDYGKTSCSVNDAAASIEKSWAHYEKKGKQPTDGTAGQRRRHC